jgi:hypothetical protein
VTPQDLDPLQKDGEITEDDLRRAEAELDRMTKKHETETTEALEAKTVGQWRADRRGRGEWRSVGGGAGRR